MKYYYRKYSDGKREIGITLPVSERAPDTIQRHGRLFRRIGSADYDGRPILSRITVYESDMATGEYREWMNSDRTRDRLESGELSLIDAKDAFRPQTTVKERYGL